ncbi:MAG: DUF4112 domain-containing protein [Halolamina sp.]
MTDSTRLDRARRVADLLDAAFTLPVIGKVGFDGLVGFVPVVGDWLMYLASLYVVYQGYRLGLPKCAVAWMLLRITVETVLSSVPLVGDLLDVVWKANQRNVARMEQHVGAD